MPFTFNVRVPLRPGGVRVGSHGGGAEVVLRRRRGTSRGEMFCGSGIVPTHATRANRGQRRGAPGGGVPVTYSHPGPRAAAHHNPRLTSNHLICFQASCHHHSLDL